MRKNSTFLIGAACVLLSACTPKSVEFKTYDLDAVTAKREVRMSELAKDLRVVPLESGADFIVSSTSKNWVNDKYILVFGQNSIEQFSAVDGKHLRTLAIKGGGPNEFDYVVNPLVDDARQILYFNKMQGETIKRIDLNTGEFLPDVEYGSTVPMNASIAQDGRLLFPSSKSVFKYLNPDNGEQDAFLQDPADSTAAGAKAKDDVKGTVVLISGAGSDFFLNGSELFLLKDTLYTVEGKELSKYCGFTFKDEVGKGEFGVEGTAANLEYVGNSDIVVSLIETRMKVERSGAGDDLITSVSMSKNEKAKVIIDRKSGEAAIMEKFIIDPSFEFDGAFLNYSFYKGSTTIAYSIEAYELQECIEEALESGDLSEKVKKELSELSGNLTEDSNPVFVIGTKR